MKFTTIELINRKIISIVLVFFLLLSAPIFSLQVKAASYTVTPLSGVLLSCNGTEVFSDADSGTLISTLPVNTPVEVVGSTSNGFWQVNLNGNICYIPQGALSMAANTTAYRLTSYDVGAALVASPVTGKIIYAQGATDKLEPASTTKIMTTLLVVEAIENGQITLDTPVMVSATALATLPTDASHVNPKLQTGEIMTVSQLLSAVMVSSDCYACNVLAELVTGSVSDFVRLMNARAAQIGCVATNFTNPSGYPDKNMYTNAISLYLITATAIAHPLFNQFFGQASTVIPSTNMCPVVRTLVNTDSLMIPGSAYYNPSVTGGKTGTANKAGQCLVSVASKEGKTIISVVLKGQNRTMYDGNIISTRYYESNRLLDFGFSNYY